MIKRYLTSLVYGLSIGLFCSFSAMATVCFLPDGNCGGVNYGYKDGSGSTCTYKTRAEANLKKGECEEVQKQGFCFYLACSMSKSDCDKAAENAPNHDKCCVPCGNCWKVDDCSIPDIPTCTGAKYETEQTCKNKNQNFKPNGKFDKNGTACGTCEDGPTPRPCSFWNTLSQTYMTEAACRKQGGIFHPGDDKDSDNNICGTCDHEPETCTPRDCSGYTYTTLSDLSNTASYEQCDNGCGTTTYRCKSGYTYSNGKCVTPQQTCVDIAATATTTVSTGDRELRFFFISDVEDGTCNKQCILHEGYCYCPQNDDNCDEDNSDPTCPYQLCDSGDEMTIGDFSDDNKYGNAYYYCTKKTVQTAYSCPEKFNDNYSYRLDGSMCKCSASTAPIFNKLCPDVASSGADAKLMIFVKDKNNSQFRSMQNQFAEIANANMEYAIPMSSTPNVGSTLSNSYKNDGYNQMSYGYKAYSKYYKLRSAIDYTDTPYTKYNKVSSVLCEMQYCTIDVSDVSKIDNYDELDASEKLKIEEIRQTLTDSNPFKPYIINAANTMSYEPVRPGVGGVGSPFTSCGSDNCASIANMYVNQKGACSAHNVAVDYVPMTTDDNMRITGDRSTLWVFYNPATLENHKPNWTYPNTRDVTNDCYASTKAAIVAEKLYDQFNAIEQYWDKKCPNDYSYYCTTRGAREIYSCRAWYGWLYRGHRCCVGRDSLNMTTSDYYPETLCDHKKELDYTQYLYMQQFIPYSLITDGFGGGSVGGEEITYEQCKKVLSDNKGLDYY